MATPFAWRLREWRLELRMPQAISNLSSLISKNMLLRDSETPGARNMPTELLRHVGMVLASTRATYQ
jgi:hypothetical protein